MASNVGGWIGRTIGPRLAASRKAERQIIERLAPDNPKEILKGMWDNLGRVIAEYPHLQTIATKHTTIINDHILHDLAKSQQPAIFFSAHMANWELPSIATRKQCGTIADITYRAPNNPYVDRILHKLRSAGNDITAHAKSRAGAQQMIKALKSRRSLAFLIDQKYNEGIAAPFFGAPAMTNPVFVQFSKKFDYPLIPIRIVRIKGCHFEITLYPALEYEKDAPIDDVVTKANMMLEDWIRQRPEQWLWLHRRWDSKALDSDFNEQ